VRLRDRTLTSTFDQIQPELANVAARLSDIQAFALEHRGRIGLHPMSIYALPGRIWEQPEPRLFEEIVPGKSYSSGWCVPIINVEAVTRQSYTNLFYGGQFCSIRTRADALQ
jgi:hypothetical protein